MESFYDKEIDSLGITIDDKENFSYTKEICPGVYVDFNTENEPIGIEIHNVKKYMRNKIYEVDIGIMYETSSNKTEKDVFNELKPLLNQFKEVTGKEATIYNINILDIDKEK